MINGKFILIVGGGHLGLYLAKALQKEKNEIVVIERDKTTAESLREELGDCVIQGDATDLGILRMAGISRADIIVTTTGYDEDNFTIAFIAKEHFGVPKTVTRLRNPENEIIFKKCGIDETVCSTTLILNTLEKQIDSQKIRSILSLEKENIEVIDLKLDAESKVLGKPIVSLGLPSDVLIIAIIRDEKSYIPKGNTYLNLNDELVILIPQGTSEEIKKYFITEDS